MKAFEELEFCDGFLFAATMEDEELCRKVLERILGIRMDVYAADEEGTVFDVEMQTTDRGNLPKRSRCYGSQMDVAALEPGDDFNKLPTRFVIFICTFDPGGQGLFRYTYTNRCEETGQELGDGAYQVFLNTKGINPEGVPEDLINFLHFVESGGICETVPEDQLLRQLHDRIRYLKRSRRMEERYMKFGELLDDERQAGRMEGRNEVLLLVEAMIADQRSEELSRLKTDPDFLEEMKVLYGITSE